MSKTPEGWGKDEVPLSVRFWKYVKKTSGCWLWTGRISKSRPYGAISIECGKKLIRANRASWIVNRGPIPEGMNVLHRCDNPICVRPSHLFLGTQGDNVRDMYAKGRR